MKNIGFLVLLLLSSSLWARPSADRARLATRLETQVQVAVQATGSVSHFEELLDNFSAQETQDIMGVVKELRAAKQAIAKQMNFPVNLQDRKKAGLIFGRLMPVMSKYQNLRRQNAKIVQVAGFAIAQEEFVSRDGRTFYVPEFIEQYVELLQDSSFPAKQEFPLVTEFKEFRAHILQDVAAFE